MVDIFVLLNKLKLDMGMINYDITEVCICVPGHMLSGIECYFNEILHIADCMMQIKMTSGLIKKV